MNGFEVRSTILPDSRDLKGCASSLPPTLSNRIGDILWLSELFGEA